MVPFIPVNNLFKELGFSDWQRCVKSLSKLTWMHQLWTNLCRGVHDSWTPDWFCSGLQPAVFSAGKSQQQSFLPCMFWFRVCMERKGCSQAGQCVVRERERGARRGWANQCALHSSTMNKILPILNSRKKNRYVAVSVDIVVGRYK